MQRGAPTQVLAAPRRNKTVPGRPSSHNHPLTYDYLHYAQQRRKRLLVDRLLREGADYEAL